MDRRFSALGVSLLKKIIQRPLAIDSMMSDFHDGVMAVIGTSFFPSGNLLQHELTLGSESSLINRTENGLTNHTKLLNVLNSLLSARLSFPPLFSILSFGSLRST